MVRRPRVPVAVPVAALATAALAVVLALASLTASAASGATAVEPAADPGLPPVPTVPGLPIVSLPTDLLVPRFIGAPAPRRPLAHPPIAQSPALAPNGTSSMHNDAYASDAYRVSGPLGRDLRVTSASYGIRECATIAFDSRRRIVALCGGLEGFQVMVIDPVTLQPIDQLTTSTRDVTSGANPLTDICGGTYFFLDDHDRVYPTTGDRSVLEIRVARDGSLERTGEWSLAGVVAEDDCLIATMPDWSGRLWFFTQQGTVGTLDRRSGRTTVARVRRGEQVTNSVATDETGGMYVVSTHALYRFDTRRRGPRAGTPRVTWRRAYDRGSRLKPGNLSQGSGTTPTLIGTKWLAINDNADPRTQVLVYDRRRGIEGKRLHCRVPVLPRGAGTTDNSLVAAGRSVIIENNYGYAGPQSTTLGRTTSPGLARVKIGRNGCRLAWTSREVAPTSVPKASLGNGLVYAYTKPARVGGRPNLADAWYFSAIDIRTGRTRWSRLTGTGMQWNNHYASIYLGPDGTAYVATLTGLVRIADGR